MVALKVKRYKDIARMAAGVLFIIILAAVFLLPAWLEGELDLALLSLLLIPLAIFACMILPFVLALVLLLCPIAGGVYLISTGSHLGICIGGVIVIGAIGYTIYFVKDVKKRA